jgi:hypothetical protein
MNDWDAVADELDVYVDMLDVTKNPAVNAKSVTREAMQFVRRVDPDAAKHLEVTLRNPSGMDARQLQAIIRGVAKTARMLGPAPSSEAAQAAQQTVTVSNVATANAVAIATATNCVNTSLDLMAQWPGIPEEAKTEIEGMKDAVAAKDKVTMMEKASHAAKLLTSYPLLAKALMDVASDASQLF